MKNDTQDPSIRPDACCPTVAIAPGGDARCSPPWSMPPTRPTRWMRNTRARLQGYTYAREGHPNADVLAQRIDALEGRRRAGVMTGSRHGGRVGACCWGCSRRAIM